MSLKIIFAGSPEISAQVLTDLINHNYQIIACYTQPDRPKGRGRTIESSAVKKIAGSYNIPVFQPKNFKDPQEIAQLQALDPDLLVVFAYGLILPKAVLQIPKFGGFNIHTSLLPKWRGAAPIQHTILGGDPRTGISIIQMDQNLDTGDILYQNSCDLTPTETTASLQLKLTSLATTAILAVLEQLSCKTIVPIPQEHNLATYANKINKIDAKIKWDEPIINIERKIRAFNPQPVAFTSLKILCSIDAPLKFCSSHQELSPVRIWQATILEPLSQSDEWFTTLNNGINHLGMINHTDPDGIMLAGTILRCDPTGIYVLTSGNYKFKGLINQEYLREGSLDGLGILKIQKLQFPGSKTLTVSEVLTAPKYKAVLQIGNIFT